LEIYTDDDPGEKAHRTHEADDGWVSHRRLRFHSHLMPSQTMSAISIAMANSAIPVKLITASVEGADCSSQFAHLAVARRVLNAEDAYNYPRRLDHGPLTLDQVGGFVHRCANRRSNVLGCFW